LVFKTLKLVIPIAGAVAGVVLSQDQLRHAEHELELMATVVDKLPDVPGQQEEMDLSEPPSQLTFPEGEALRGLRALLFEQDRGRSFGDLRRVHAPSGDFLWVCPTHYPEYDPGLPNIPGSQHHPE
jgi:internalin A